MPIYEYECSACGCRFERRQKFDSDPKFSCPRCEAECRRVMHSVPVIFKGSGWYSTDHRTSPGDWEARRDGEKKVEPDATADATAAATPTSETPAKETAAKETA